MTVSRPSSALAWATNSNGADSISAVPSAGRQANGFDGTTFPEFLYENWYKRQNMLWQQWFDQQEQIHTPAISALQGTSGTPFNVLFYGGSTPMTVSYINYPSNRVKIWWTDVSGLSGGSYYQVGGSTIPIAVTPSAPRHFPCVIGSKLGVLTFYDTRDARVESSDGSVFTGFSSGCAEYTI
jgi:hypothetical protein